MSEASNATMNFPRRDARDKLRGRTRYTVDQVRPGMLHAALARAQVPSARILRIDVSAARKMPGVRAVATAVDAPFRHGIGVADHPLFATGSIRYNGEPLAAIAAPLLLPMRMDDSTSKHPPKSPGRSKTRPRGF
jgi:CO/xanthine dehydrogenase Mo-binding subunit